MKVGLYNLEPKIENTAMMKVSQYHKQQGDWVKRYNHLFPLSYDRVYAFSLFDFTPKTYVKKGMICGGTGFNIKRKLPEEIDKCGLDYSIFPKCKTSYVRFSKGCFRDCAFCVVRQKEGLIKPSWEVNLNPKGDYISILDNNFFSIKTWKKSIKWLQQQQQLMDFQGVDARILTKEMCEALNKFKHRKQIHIAWDNPKEDVKPQLKKIIKIIKPYKLMCYVLIGFNSTPKEDMFRIEELEKLKIDPFVMPYNKKRKYQKDLARWCNHTAIRKTVRFKDYKGGKNNE